MKDDTRCTLPPPVFPSQACPPQKLNQDSGLALLCTVSEAYSPAPLRSPPTNKNSIHMFPADCAAQRCNCCMKLLPTWLAVGGGGGHSTMFCKTDSYPFLFDDSQNKRKSLDINPQNLRCQSSDWVTLKMQEEVNCLLGLRDRHSTHLNCQSTS